MAKRRVCRGPSNPLLMMRTRGLRGPFFQNTGAACIKTQGNAFAQGGPLAGIGYRSGQVITANTIDVTFSEAPLGNLQAGVSIEIDGVPATITNAVAAGSVVTYTITQSVTDDDVVTWIYDEDVGDITGENGNELRDGTYPVTNSIDTKPPTLQTAEVGNIGGNTYSLTFSEPIQSTDFAAGWSVDINAVPQTMTGNSLYQGGVLYLTTVQYVQEGDTVTISYNSVAGDITDVTGYPALNALADITDFSVTNNVTPGPDLERPQITAFQANSGSGVSTSRTISIDILDASDNVSAAADMEYQVNTTPANPPAPGDPNWVSFANRLDPITVPSDGTFTLTAYVKDEADNVSLGIGISQQVVEVDSIAPTVINANVDALGTTLTINLSEDVTGNAGFSLTADGGAKALSAPGGSGSQITFTCAQVFQGQTCLLSYTAGDVQDLLGNPLANFTDAAVTNGSTVPDTGWDPSELFASGEAGAWFDPSDLSSMFQDDAGTIPVTAVGQAVGRVNDKSGNGNHMTADAEARKPILQQDGNLNYYLDFDGVDDRMHATQAIGDSWTLVAGLERGTVVGGMPFGNRAAGNDRLGIRYDELRLAVGGLYGAWISRSLASPPDEIAVISALIVDAVSVEAYRNRVELLQAANSYVGDLDGMDLGGSSSGNFIWGGKMYGVIFSETLASAENFSEAEEWMADKCGVTLP